MDTAYGELEANKEKKKEQSTGATPPISIAAREMVGKIGNRPEDLLSSCASGSPWPRLRAPRRPWIFRLSVLVAWLGTFLDSQGFVVYMRRSDGTRGKRGASPDEENRVRPEVSLMRYPTSKLDQRVRWTRREDDAKKDDESSVLKND